MDAWAVGVSVAVEAVASLVQLEKTKEEENNEADQIVDLQQRTRQWLATQSDLREDLTRRVAGLVDHMGKKRPEDILYPLAAAGRVEKLYVLAWRDLRNRHVHPKLKDLKKPSPIDNQKLIDSIHRAEVLLRQLTFHLIGYSGPFTDYGVYGVHDFPSKQYPLVLPPADSKVVGDQGRQGVAEDQASVKGIL